MARRVLEPGEVPGVLRQAFPAYTGRTFAVVVGESVTLSGGYWDGGSRSTYRAVELSSGRTADPAGFILNPPQFGGPASSPVVPLLPGWCVVEHAIFRGKCQGLTFYIRADNAARMLPAPAYTGELSLEALAVLEVSCGIISRARRERAAYDFGVKGEAYDRGLAELKRLGYVNPQGAATARGQNARLALGDVIRRRSRFGGVLPCAD